MDFSDQLRGLIEAQDGLVHRRQLLEAGVTPSALRWHLGRRRQLVLPGVVATVTGTLTPRQRLVAGQLMAGPAGTHARRLPLHPSRGQATRTRQAPRSAARA
jgi:hypothetical protein